MAKIENEASKIENEASKIENEACTYLGKTKRNGHNHPQDQGKELVKWTDNSKHTNKEETGAKTLPWDGN